MEMEKKPQADRLIFYICLALAAGLFIGSFFCPPVGAIDDSILKAGAILLAMQALGIVGQNLANGKEMWFKKADLEVKVGDNEDE